MIDKLSGTLSYGDKQQIDPRLTKTAFLASSLGKQAYIYVDNPPFVSYTCGFAASSIPQVVATLFFNSEKLCSVRLILIPQSVGASVIDWKSLEYQAQMKEYYPQFLEGELGSPPYEYPWGQVSAGMDDRTGYVFSYIWVTYHRV